MFDTMTATKVVGAACGSLLVFLLGGWAAQSIYHMGPAEGSKETVAQAYTVEVASADAGAGDAAAGPTFEDVLKTADAAAGEKVFSKCKACHNVEGKNGTGPHLNGVVGRPAASVADYNYDDALNKLNPEPWTPEHLNGFLTNPKKYAPGTKMSFAGLPKVQDRANIIAWLETQK